MAPGLIFALIVIGGIVLAVALFAVLGRRTRRDQHELLGEANRTLTYRVPEGQDPAAVLATLGGGGFKVAPAPGDTHTLLIECPDGVERQREQVRALIENEAPLNLEGDPIDVGRVVFADE